MTTRTVTTQAQLDAALADPDVDHIDIRSEPGVWLRLDHNGTVEARDSSTVRARGSSTVEARGSSTVEAWGSSTVEARDSSTVEARDSSTVEARDSSTVRAWGSSTVEARDSSTVEAWGSSTVEAWGSSTVEARDSSTVRAWGSSTVEARGSSTVRAGSHTAVHLHSGTARVEGGVLIDHTAVILSDAAAWCDYHGVHVEAGHAVLYKAVRSDLRSQHGAIYIPGSTSTCDDWADTDECGSGLHISPTPAQAGEYDLEASRYLECRIPLASLRPITGSDAPKCKTPAVEVVREVDAHGRPVEAAAP